ncbi:MAG: hypothetical protein AAGB05_05865 [Pseudomonadota bacterium]
MPDCGTGCAAWVNATASRHVVNPDPLAGPPAAGLPFASEWGHGRGARDAAEEG